MIRHELAAHYKEQRKAGKSPRLAIDNARARKAAGLPPDIGLAGATYYNPWNKSHGSKWRIVENPRLRYCGTTSEIAREHSYSWRDYPLGYYLDTEFCSETASPCVYQLPGRKGKPLYVPGFPDPYGNEAAFIAFGDSTDDKWQAAKWADDFARLYAEAENEYQTEWRGGSQWAEAAATIKESRIELAELARDRRKAAGVDIEAPAICKAIAGHVRTLKAAIKQAAATMAELESRFDVDSEAFREGANT